MALQLRDSDSGPYRVVYDEFRIRKRYLWFGLGKMYLVIERWCREGDYSMGGGFEWSGDGGWYWYARFDPGDSGQLAIDHLNDLGVKYDKERGVWWKQDSEKPWCV